MPPFLSNSLWIHYNKENYNWYGNIKREIYLNIVARRKERVINDLKDDYGYLPTNHRLTKTLKRLIKNYAPESYEHYIVADTINKMDTYLNDEHTYKNMTNLYNIFKKGLYKAADMYELTKTDTKHNHELWKYITIIRDIARWELEPALNAQLEKEMHISCIV